jgi:hypothetical protein
MSGESCGFKDGEPDRIERLLPLPPVANLIYPDQVDAIRNLGIRLRQ